MSEAFLELAQRPSATSASGNGTYPFRQKPRLLTLGGDHSIALPALRALTQVYGQPISVVHFDAHLDTWDPSAYPSSWLDPSDPNTQSFFTHGTMFWMAARENLIANASSVHAGLRSRLLGLEDYENDTAQGWVRISADDIDDFGVHGIVKRILDQVGHEKPVYLSVDIDVIDASLAPGTGTPEPGGWTMRELIRILRGIEALNVVGADIVEVSPAYDGVGEVTALAAAQVGFEILTSMVKRGLVVGKDNANDKSGGRDAIKDEL